MGIFNTAASDVFTTYHARLVFRDRLMGGVPTNPKIIEAWLRSKAGIEQEEEIRRAMLRTLLELGAEVSPDMSFAELEAASEGLAAQRQTNGFKTDTHGLYIESRQIKAMLKESTNVLFAGERWGVTKKGPRSFVAERIFIAQDRIPLGRMEPDGVELFIGHVSGPKGPQSTLTYHQYVERPTLEFDVLALRDQVKPEQWREVWLHAQENGLGALRSQGFGRFDVEAWDAP